MSALFTQPRDLLVSQAAAAVQSKGSAGVGGEADRAGLADRLLLRSWTFRLRTAPAAHGAGGDQLRHSTAELGRPAPAGQDRPDRRAGDVERAGPVRGGQSARVGPGAGANRSPGTTAQRKSDSPESAAGL